MDASKIAAADFEKRLSDEVRKISEAGGWATTAQGRLAKRFFDSGWGVKVATCKDANWNIEKVKKEINIKISDKAPKEYLSVLGLTRDDNVVIKNFKENAVPLELFDMDVSNYQEFLTIRRKLMADKIKDYYYSL